MVGAEDVPVVHTLVTHESQGSLVDPPPIYNILGHGARLEALLGLQIEQLEGPRLGLERDDGLGQVHYGALGADGPPDDVVEVLEVQNDRLGRRVGLACLAHANVLVGL